MFGNRLIKSNNAGAACTTDTVQILDGVPLESIATYQLNNATTSIPNNTYPGTAYSANYAAGKFGNAYSNDGSAKYILLPRVLSTNFTWSFWVNFNSLSTCRFFGLEGGTFNPDLVFQLDGNGIRCYSGTPNGWIQLTSNPSINTWYHIVAVSGVGIYVNNTLYPASFLAQPSGSGPIGVGTDGVDIGENGYLDGLIDQVRIFNTALSAGAVTSLYNETVATASNSYINVPSCIAYYKMSDATDETGSYDGTPTNVNFNVAGKFGNAGEFNGSSSSKINLPSNFNLANNSFTISAWWGNTKSSGNSYGITSSGSGSTCHTNLHIGRRGSNGKFSFAFFCNDLDSSTSISTDGTWQHWVCTYDASTNSRKIYLNGIEDASNTASNDYIGTANLQLGGGTNWGTGNEYQGKLDQVRIFNRAITANEVTTLYNEVECIPTIAPTDYFNTVLYTGNGTSQTITGVGFDPDMVWVKSRTTTSSNALVDSVRGATNTIFSDLTNAELVRQSVTSFDVNGFTVGNYGNVNANAADFVAWNWKAGGAAVAATSIEATNATRSANVDAGFSIMKFQSSNSTVQPPPMNYIEHGLDATQKWLFTKS